MGAEEEVFCLVEMDPSRFDIRLEFKYFISDRHFALMTQLHLMHLIVSFKIQTRAIYSEKLETNVLV